MKIRIFMPCVIGLISLIFWIAGNQAENKNVVTFFYSLSGLLFLTASFSYFSLKNINAELRVKMHKPKVLKAKPPVKVNCEILDFNAVDGPMLIITTNEEN